MKNLRYKFVAILIGALIGLGSWTWYAQEKQEHLVHPMSIPPDYYYLDNPNDIYGKTGIVSIAGREFEIPVAYVQGNFKNGRREGDVLLKYVLPGYKSILEFPDAEERRQLALKGLIRGMLLEASAARPSFDLMIENTDKIVDRLGGYEKEVHGLEKFSVIDWEGRMSVQPDDTFIQRTAENKIQSFIRCSPPGKDRVPGCNHKFRNKELLFSIRWNLSDLPEWEARRDEAIQFINQFEIKDKERGKMP